MCGEKTGKRLLSRSVMIYKIRNSIMEYTWGSGTDIPLLLGIENRRNIPMAELWMGAHPKAPSRVETENGVQSLSTLIRDDPEGVLGERVVREFGKTLPFLFKVIAVEKPLSIQVHPNKLQAQKGFEAENGKGIPLDDPKRNYKDRNHKPEIICAVSEVRGLFGFRPWEAIVRDFETLGCAEFLPTGREFLDKAGCYEHVMRALLVMPEKETLSMISETIRAVRTILEKDRLCPEERFLLVLSLYEQYPKDIGSLFPLVLEYRSLDPGEAVFIDAGIPHAYMKGMGIELMANSDNVLRAGLTPKHVDRGEVLSVIDYGNPGVLTITPDPVQGELQYRAPVREFLLSAIHVSEGKPYERTEPSGSVEILLCVDGALRIKGSSSDAAMRKGESLLVTASERRYALVGSGIVYKAGIP